ncbi:MAG: tRNA pseudouridine synthase A [Phycisphaeraceae bacterium]|nr:MAG: tRNA pseudouridine synthase A [Phycisphaeraceae bacterium]
MPRYALTIAYDGSDFCGWQKQEPVCPEPGGGGPGVPGAGSQPPPSDKIVGPVEGRPGRVALRTVQHVAERAVREVVREPIELIGASRTDAGVHARGQVAAFTCAPLDPPRGDGSDATPEGRGWPRSRGLDALVRAVNGKLPEDVLVVGAWDAGVGFDPIGGCTSKGYSYTIHASRRRPLFDRRFVHHVWEPLDVGAMSEAASAFVGEHDFAGFAAAGHGRLTTVRRVLSCAVTRVSDERVRIDISGTGFLYNMVRIIAGTLAEAGRGRIGPGEIPGIIASRERSKAGPTFPARGLCLEWVRYDGSEGPAAG